MTVSKYFIVVSLLVVQSCQHENQKNASNKLCLIDVNADNRLYKLNILNEDSNSDYRVSEDGSCFVLVQKEIHSLGKIFRGDDNIGKALEHYKQNNLHSAERELYSLTTISIETPTGLFSEIWHWKSPINLNEEGGYGIYEFRLWPEENNFKYKDWYKRGIQIFLKHDFNGDGYKMYSFNFIRENKLWKLISRECINTTRDSSINVFCKDTLNSNFDREAEKFYLTFESLNLYDAICH